MAEDVGVLVARLTADTKGLRADMEKASKQLSGSTAKMNRSLMKTERHTRSMAKGFNTANVAIVAYAAAMTGRFIRAQIDAAAAILDTADKVGVQVEALQELRFAGAQYGITQRNTDLAIQRFSRRLGEAAIGTGVLKNTIAELNIQLFDSEGKMRSVEDVLADYSDSIQSAESQQEALRLAFQAFDSEGAAFVTVMRNGSTGLKAFASRARELGIVMDREMIEKAKLASDRFTELSFVMNQQMLVAVNENADAFVKFGETAIIAVEGLTNATGFLLGKLNEIGLFWSAIASGDGKIALDRLRTLYGLTSGAGNGGGTVSGVLPGVGGGTTSSADGTAAGGGLQEIVSTATKKFMTFGTEHAEINEGLERVRLLKEQMEESMTALHIAHATRRADVSRAEAEERITSQQSVVNDTLTGLGLLAQHSKKAFKVQKAAKIAQAVMATHAGVAEALTLPYPLNFAVAAAVAFKGAAQISAIKSQTFGGGSGFAGVGGTTVGTNQNPVVTQPSTVQPGDSFGNAVQIVFQGDVFGWDDFIRERVISGIREAVDERDVVIIGAESRQASELGGG